MKILFVQEYYYPYIGGIENLFKFLAEKLIERGHEVFVVTSKYDKSLPKEDVINGVNILRVNTRNRMLFALMAIVPAYKIACKADLVQTTTYTGVMPAVIAGKFARKKVIVTYHEYWGKLWFKLPFLSLTSRILNFTLEYFMAKLPYDKIITVSDFTKRSLEQNKVNPEKIVRIYNGLDYSEFANFSKQTPKDFTFTYFGRLGVSKGLDILIKAAGLFINKQKDVRFKLIIPKIPEKMYKRVIKMTEENKLSGQIQILNNLSKEQLYMELCKSSCVVIPSYSEGFCFTAAESIGLGIPVISSNKGALPEVVCGKFIKLKELTINDLHLALVDAYDGKWELSDMKKFELNTQINAYEALYKFLSSNNNTG